jgi:P-type Cu2+ transporter
MSLPSSASGASVAPDAPARDADAAAPCYHCGLPNPPSARWRAVVAGAPREFCCAGCLAVAQTIHAAGLDAFYDRRTVSADRPGDAPDDEWSRWDDPAAQAGFVRALPQGGREVALLLEGMHCGACVWLLESWLQRQPGVGEASINFATRRARVVFDPAATRVSAVLRAVAAVGYRAHPYDPARREEFARRESRALLLRMSVALLAMMQVMMLALPTYITADGVEPEHRRLLEWASLTLTLPALLYSASPFFRGAWRDLMLARPGMDVPVALGLAAAFGASAWATFSGEGAVYYDSVTMFIALLLVARYVELTARRRAGDAIEAVARAQPATAERLPAFPRTRDGEIVGAATLAAGEFVLVRAGAPVPCDGVVVDGRAAVDEAILTGESQPRVREPGERVLAGSIARDGALVVQVTAAGDGTRLAAIERAAARAATGRPRVARVADRVARWFVAGLLVLAVATAIAWWQIDPARALPVTFALLVVSCPCALSLATPAALAAAAGALARRQVVVTHPDALESFARVTHVVLDKTGTLTEGRPGLTGLSLLRGTSRERALALAAALEAPSEHPLAGALRAAAAGLPRIAVADVVVVPGQGLEGVVDGVAVRLGRASFVAAIAGGVRAEAAPGGATDTAVVLGDGRGPLAVFALGDRWRTGARDLVAGLSSLGITPVLLSGDRQSAVAATAAALGIADARGDTLPEDKRDAIATLQQRGAVVAMVGDGINDAPALAQAQVSASLGSATPLAQWTADIVILADDLTRLTATIRHARRTLAVVRQNLAWAFAYNAVAIPAAALGYVTPLVAAIGMSASSLLVVGNALRVARMTGAPTRGDEHDDRRICALPDAAPRSRSGPA